MTLGLAITMEAATVHSFSPSFAANRIKHFSKLHANRPLQGLNLRQQQQCKNGRMALGSEKQLEAEIVTDAEEEEWLTMGKSRDKCKERKGMVELLECLEREAIMGDDEGKEPTDYNRRAQIFDKSSRVFQALKEHSSSLGEQSCLY